MLLTMESLLMMLDPDISLVDIAQPYGKGFKGALCV